MGSENVRKNYKATDKYKERYTMSTERLINSPEFWDKMVKEVMRQTLNECSDLEPTVNGAAWYPKNGTLKVLIKLIFNFDL
jgi:hypothetical protein